MNAKERQKLWRKMHLPAKQKAVSFKRTEGQTRFYYPNKVAHAFDAWARAMRDTGKVPMFAVFYETMGDEYKELVTVEQVEEETPPHHSLWAI